MKIIIMLICLCITLLHNTSLAKELTIEEIFLKVKSNNNLLEDLKGRVSKDYLMNKNILNQVIELFYKKPNMLKMVTKQKPSTIMAIDGEYLYIKNESYDKVDKQRVKISEDNLLFKFNYYLSWETIENKFICNSARITEKNGTIYKIVKKAEKESQSEEIWIDYIKGVITKYSIYNNNIKILLEVKKISKVNNIYLPTTIQYEIAIPEKIITLLNWHNLEINKRLLDEEFKIR
ncbi:MAG: hypothetical protein A2297_06805 [Elusimicrobia bacterium RIFOXYB2_FULL_48_7]|nr:MAG: hypothetical protein A2297_06805 [Elusimicrobia bacterium RIFOXYB2_FULL_48_7]